MIDTLTSFNYGDFSARYKGTYGFFISDSGTKLLVQVTQVDRKQASFVDLRGGEYAAYVDSGIQFEFIPINRGFFNTAHGVYFLNRVPARQWHRGICGDNTNIYCLDRAWQQVGAGSREFFRVLHNIFVDPRPEPAEVFQQQRNGDRIAVALSKNFALEADLFYFLQQRVGTLVEGAIKVDTPLVIQEVKDAVRRAGIPLEVV